MCVRNVNSYGCGCEYKEINECGRDCEPEVGYRFIREYDCSKCKAGGHEVTRGRNGQGRHAQAIQRRQNKEELQSITGPVVDVDGEVLAWASTPVEQSTKSWQKGRRRDADQAWEDEHSSRMDDLCSRAESMSMRSDTTPRPTPSKLQTKYRRSPSPIEPSSSTDEDRHSRHSRGSKKLFGEIMHVSDYEHQHPRRHRQPVPRSYYESQDSLDSMPKISPGTRSRKGDGYDPYDSGYGSHGSRRSQGSRHSPRSHYGSQTEAYSYSTSPTKHVYQVSYPGQHYAYPAGGYSPQRHYPPHPSLPQYTTF